MGLELSGLVFLDDAGWVVMMLARCGVIVGSDGLWVCKREGSEGGNNKKLLKNEYFIE